MKNLALTTYYFLVMFSLSGCNNSSKSKLVSGQLTLSASCARNAPAPCTLESTAIFVTVGTAAVAPTTSQLITLNSDNQNIIYTDSSESTCMLSSTIPSCVFEYFPGSESGTANITASSNNPNFLESSTQVTLSN